MILDAQMVLDTATAITSGAVTSANPLDQGSTGREYSQGGFFIVKTNGVAFAGGTSIDIQLQTADDSGFTTNLQTVYDSGSILLASLTANTELLKIQCPMNLRRYIRFNYTPTGTFTAGSVEAFFVIDPRLPEYAFSGGQ